MEFPSEYKEPWVQHLQNSFLLFLIISRESFFFFFKGKSPHQLTKADKALLAKALPAACSFNTTNRFSGVGGFALSSVSVHHPQSLNG